MRTLKVAGVVLLVVLSLPSIASAQASITGVVKDPSGAGAARGDGRGVQPRR